MCAQRRFRPQDYKIYFMLNSAEHEIFLANKYETANYICSDQQ